MQVSIRRSTKDMLSNCFARKRFHNNDKFLTALAIAFLNKLSSKTGIDIKLKIGVMEVGFDCAGDQIL